MLRVEIIRGAGHAEIKETERAERTEEVVKVKTLVIIAENEETLNSRAHQLGVQARQCMCVCESIHVDTPQPQPPPPPPPHIQTHSSPPYPPPPTVG